MAPLTYFFGDWNQKTWFCEDFKEKNDIFRKQSFPNFYP